MPKLDLGKIKEGARRVMPLLETAAALTANKTDDLVVLFLKKFLEMEEAEAEKVMKAVESGKME